MPRIPARKKCPRPTKRDAVTFDSYLAALDAGPRAALEAVRRAVRAAVPGVEECISYGVPSFRVDGRFLVALGAAKHHCSFYLGSTIQRHAKLLAGFDTSKGTIRFSADRPLSATLVKRLVRARLAERRSAR